MTQKPQPSLQESLKPKKSVALSGRRPRFEWLARLQAAAHQPIIGSRRSIAQAARYIHGGKTLADIMAPPAYQLIGMDMIQAGDSFMQVLELRFWPPAVGMGFLGLPDLKMNTPGVIVHQRIEPVPDAQARQILEQSESSARSTASNDEETGMSTDLSAEEGGKAAQDLRRALVAGQDRMYQYVLTITVTGDSAAVVSQIVDEIRLGASGQGFGFSVAQMLQFDGYQSTLPRGEAPNMLRHDTSGKVVAMAIPTHVGADLHTAKGQPLIWGRHAQTNQLIMWDSWTATNPHGLVIAESGSGKTYSMGGLIAQQLMLGEDAICILDPKQQEYRRLTEALGGAYVSFSNTGRFHINPFELPKVTAERAEILRRHDTNLLSERIGIVRSMIAQALNSNNSPVDAVGIMLIEEAITGAYAKKGITSDYRTFARSMPTFGDVRQQLNDLSIDHLEPELRPIARQLALQMGMFTHGRIGDLFNHESNIPTNNPLLALDISALLKSNDPVLRQLIPVIVADFFITVAINQLSGRKRSHLVLDEGHALLETEAGLLAMKNIYRIGRSLNFAGTVISQSINDLARSSDTALLMENSSTKLLLGVNKRSGAIDDVTALLQLNPAERQYAQGCGLIKGVGSYGLLLANGQRVPLFIPPWNPSLHRVLSSKEGS